MATHPPHPLPTGTARPPAPAGAAARPVAPAGPAAPGGPAAPAATARPGISRLPGVATGAARWPPGPTFRVVFAGSLLACACVVGPGGATAQAADAPPDGVPAQTAPADRAPAADHPGEKDPHTTSRAAGHPVPAGAYRPAAGAQPAPHRARPARSRALADAGQGPMPALATAAVILLLGGAGLLTAARRLRG
ncbi:hypothetical protein [Streptomyces sp. NPDC014733]|uniref:hypothetical protein n=1 Tax=Streptomyces sp. NPDC014733 TaxID=3364885 RepID=UPI0036FBCB7D